MKTSGTKPMKNTMRKPSPAKMMTATKKVSATAKPVEGKPNAATVKTTKTTKVTKSPAMQMKKSGMGKKC